VSVASGEFNDYKERKVNIKEIIHKITLPKTVTLNSFQGLTNAAGKMLNLFQHDKGSVLLLAGSIFVCELAGIASMFVNKFVITDISLIWYGYLYKPALNPTDWVFQGGWTVMYLLMGIALFLVLKTPVGADTQVCPKNQGAHTGAPLQMIRGKTSALAIFSITLLLSTAIAPVFFGFESALGAFGASVLLWVFLFLCFYKFYKVTVPAALLLAPPILWTSYIMGLTFTFWLFNDTHLMFP
jgi:translocator protein